MILKSKTSIDCILLFMIVCFCTTQIACSSAIKCSQKKVKGFNVFKSLYGKKFNHLVCKYSNKIFTDDYLKNTYDENIPKTNNIEFYIEPYNIDSITNFGVYIFNVARTGEAQVRYKGGLSTWNFLLLFPENIVFINAIDEDMNKLTVEKHDNELSLIIGKGAMKKIKPKLIKGYMDFKNK